MFSPVWRKEANKLANIRKLNALNKLLSAAGGACSPAGRAARRAGQLLITAAGRLTHRLTYLKPPAFSKLQPSSLVAGACRHIGAPQFTPPKLPLFVAVKFIS